MSYLSIFLLSLLGLYCASAWIYTAYYYYLSCRRHCGITQFTASRFFVRPNESSKATLSLKPVAASSKQKQQAADICLLVDISSSMLGDNIKQALWGAKVFVNNARISPDQVHMGIAWFNHESGVFLPLTNRPRALRKAICNIPDPTGGTDLSAGLKSAISVLAESSRAADDSVKKYIIMLTDGATANREQALDTARRLKADGINLFCIGIADADQEFLRQVAGYSDDYVDGNSQTELPAFYTDEPQQLTAFLENIREMVEGSSATAITTSLKFNHQQLIYQGTSTHQKLQATEPMQWFLPLLKPQGEKIEFEFSTVHCIGRVALNLESVSTEYQLEQDDASPDDAPQFESNPVRRSVIIVPFLPPWLFVTLVHPLLWKPLQTRLCPGKKIALKAARLPEFQAVTSVQLPPPPDIRTQNWYPTICIGLGGAGIATVMRLKSLLMDATTDNASQDSFRFLNIDTDTRQPQTAIFGLAEMAEDEFICIGADLRSEHLASAGDPAKNPWYPHQLNNGLDIELFDTRLGCSGNRSLARLALHKYLREDDALKEQLATLTSWLASHDKTLPKKVLLFCSTKGGVGSGIFFDIAHIILGLMEEQSMESQAIDLIVPQLRSDMLGSGGQHANEAAFLLELERAKSMAGLSLDLADYPGANPLRFSRFIHAEYFIDMQDDEQSDPLLLAAAMAMCLVNRDEQLDRGITNQILSDSQGQGSGHSMPVSAAINVSCLPLFACERYLEYTFLLDLLKKNEGISLDSMHRYQDGAIELEPAWVNSQLRLLFNDQPMPGENTGLKTALPSLFSYMAGLAKDSSEKLYKLNMLTGALESMPDMRSPSLRQDNLQTASVRVAEWVYRILQQSDQPRLASALVLTENVEKILFKAIESVHAQTLNVHDSVEKLLLFEESRLQQLNRLVYDYIHVIQIMTEHLQRWAFLLGEGLPLSRMPLSGSSAKMPFIGLARKYHRRQTLALQAVEDYLHTDLATFRGKLDDCYAAKLAEMPSKARDDIESNITWVLDPVFLNATNPWVHLTETRKSPFQLEIGDGNGNSITIQPQPDDQTGMEQTLTLLLQHCEPWISLKNRPISLEVPLEPTARPGNRRAVFQQDEASFARQAAIIKLAFSTSDQYRDSAVFQQYKDSDAIRRGHRNHVLKPDRDAAILQRIYAKNRPLQAPMHPRAVCLLEDMHILQRYLYLYLDDKVTQANHPDDHREMLVVELAGQRFWLRETSAEFDAAIQFVLKKRCLLTGADIQLENDWRPDANDLENLSSQLRKGFSGFLLEFEILLVVMEKEKGYVQPFGQLTTAFLQEMLSA